MRILLVEPPISPFDIPTGTFGLPPPYHLEMLAGGLTDNHDVAIIDMRIDRGLDKQLRAFQPDMVGCSCVAANHFFTEEMFLQVKQHNPNTWTVVGGHHASLVPEECNEHNTDFVVIGEGEVTIQELVRCCETGGAAPYSPKPLPEKLASITGIAYKTADGEFKITPPRPLMDLSDLPSPARYLTKKYRGKQRYFRASWRPTDCIISSRGCPHRCNFCGIWKVNHGKYRSRPASAIADEIQRITDPYVTFVDDNSLHDVDNMMALAAHLERRGIKKTYEFYGRADTVAKHPGLIERMREVGMRLLLLGLESCSQKTLDGMNKKILLESNRKAIEICHANDVEVAAYLIVDPQFSRDDFRRLSDYVEENKLTHPIFTILTPFPGTDLYEDVKHSLLTDDRRLVDFYHTVLPTKLPLEEFYAEFAALYRQAYPMRRFFTSGFRGMAMFSPRNLHNNLRIKRKLSRLFRHHREVAPPRRENHEPPENQTARP